MTKRVVIALLIGWGIGLFISPKDVMGWVRSRGGSS